MIARIWRDVVQLDDADANYIRDTGFAEYAETSGNRGTWMLRRDQGDRSELRRSIQAVSLPLTEATAGAVLDVFATEPLPADFPLWTLDDVLVTPHWAAQSARENERIVELFVANLRRYLDMEPLVNVVEPGVFY